MKCTKCGFVSFDYLSECRKCGADISTARNQLGFSTVKPSVPSLLGSLLGKSAPLPELGPVPVEEPSALPTFDFEEEPEIAGGFKLVDSESDGGAPGKVSATSPDSDEGEEDFSLLDLTDDELDLLIDKDQNPSQRPDPAQAAVANGGVPRSGGLIPDFNIDSLPGLSAKREQPAPAAKPAAKAPKQPGEAATEDDFVIELSEKDLQSLLTNLGDVPESDAAKEKAAPEEPKGDLDELVLELDKLGNFQLDPEEPPAGQKK